MTDGYELETPRLRLRPVSAEDVEVLTALGSDTRVMTAVGGPLSRERTCAWIDAQVDHWRRHGYGRFILSHEGTFVGVVGLTQADRDAGIVPDVEVAWRLAYSHWGHGYATEAAHRVIRDGFERLGLDTVIAVTTPGNARSIRVMERLGMVLSPGEAFDHPRLAVDHPLRRHVVYRLRNDASPNGA